MIAALGLESTSPPSLANSPVLVLSSTRALHSSCGGQGHDGEGLLATKTSWLDRLMHSEVIARSALRHITP